MGMVRKIKWDKRFLELAEHISKWSRDPSTKVGSVIVDKNNRVISIGFNGFPKGVKDYKKRYDNRDIKYKMVVHAEANSILFAQRDLTGCTLYTFPFQSCSNCAKLVIQSGITCCVAPKTPKSILERWGEDLIIANKMFKEAGVKIIYY